VAVVADLVVLFRKFPSACIALCGHTEVFDAFRGHIIRGRRFESLVDIQDFLLEKVYNFFGDVFSFVLLGIVYQFGFVDGIVEALNVVAKSTGVVFLVSCGTRPVWTFLFCI
jgi:hypothetical protein